MMVSAYGLQLQRSIASRMLVIRMDGMQTVLDTATSGVGYYFTEGTKYSIRWYCDDTGSLVFLNDSGAKLNANRGKSYIAYAKSTMYGDLLIEP